MDQQHASSCLSIVLAGALALVTARAAAQPAPTITARDSATRDTLARALAPVLAARFRARAPEAARLLRAPRPVWDVWAPHVAPAATRLLLDSVLAGAGGRARSRGDAAWTDVGITRAFVAGDSAVVGVDLGARWCDRPGFAPNGAGDAYEFVLRRAGGRWAFAYVADVSFTYDPAPRTDGPAPPPAPTGGRRGRCDG